MRLYLGSYFAFFRPERRHWVEVDLPHPKPLREILVDVGVPAAEVHLVVVNDQVSESIDLVVFDTDTVRLFPPVGGG